MAFLILAITHSDDKVNNEAALLRRQRSVYAELCNRSSVLTTAFYKQNIKYFTGSKLLTYLLMFSSKVNGDRDVIDRIRSLPPCGWIAIHHLWCVMRKTGIWCMAVRHVSLSRRFVPFRNAEIVFHSGQTTSRACCNRLKKSHICCPSYRMEMDGNKYQGNPKYFPCRHLWRLAFDLLETLVRC